MSFKNIELQKNCLTCGTPEVYAFGLEVDWKNCSGKNKLITIREWDEDNRDIFLLTHVCEKWKLLENLSIALKYQQEDLKNENI